MAKIEVTKIELAILISKLTADIDTLKHNLWQARLLDDHENVNTFKKSIKRLEGINKKLYKGFPNESEADDNGS